MEILHFYSSFSHYAIEEPGKDHILSFLMFKYFMREGYLVTVHEMSKPKWTRTLYVSDD